MIYVILGIVGLVAGLLSGAVGFGGGMIILPVITYFYGIEVAVPVATIAQLMSNLGKISFTFKQINFKYGGLFLVTALPLTALGALGFSIAPKVLMTRLLGVFLIVFAILKIAGKMNLPKRKGTILIGGGITGLINGMMGISGPLSSAVFLTVGLSPVAYIATEATAAAAMHIVKTIMYNKLALLDMTGLLHGLYIGAAMMIGNYIAIHFLKKVDNKKFYQTFVAIVMIAASLWLIISA